MGPIPRSAQACKAACDGTFGCNSVLHGGRPAGVSAAGALECISPDPARSGAPSRGRRPLVVRTAMPVALQVLLGFSVAWSVCLLSVRHFLTSIAVKGLMNNFLRPPRSCGGLALGAVSAFLQQTTGKRRLLRPFALRPTFRSRSPNTMSRCF